MPPKPLTLKITQWLLFGLSILGVLSALIVIASSSTTQSILQTLGPAINPQGLTGENLTIAVVAQIVLHSLMLAAALGIMNSKKWGFWLAISLLGLYVGLNLWPKIQLASLLIVFILLVMLFKDRKYFEADPKSDPNPSGRSVRTARARN